MQTFLLFESETSKKHFKHILVSFNIRVKIEFLPSAATSRFCPKAIARSKSHTTTYLHNSYLTQFELNEIFSEFLELSEFGGNFSDEVPKFLPFDSIPETHLVPGPQHPKFDPKYITSCIFQAHESKILHTTYFSF